MRVVYFGTYERDYPRNAQVISCLRRAGVEVVERHESVWEGSRQNWAAGGRTALRLLAAEAKLALHTRPRYFDAMIVGYPGQFDVAGARSIAGRRPLILNPLVSLTETLVDDRRRFAPRSPAARVLRAIDRFALRRADLVVADTAENAAFLAGLGGISSARVEVCLVGAEERLFQPTWRRSDDFHALFVGKLIPLHGVETILEAARLTPEIPFRVVGSGQLDALMQAAPANVEWVPWVDYAELPRELGRAGCALGVFGASAKARRVIPNKAFQALACGTPLITADTPAARELLMAEDNALLVPPGDADALATAVRRLADNGALATRIGAGGLAAYRSHASEEVLGRRWRGLLERLVLGI